MPDVKTYAGPAGRPVSPPAVKLLLTTIPIWLPTLLFLVLAYGIRSDQPLPGDETVAWIVHLRFSQLWDTPAQLVTNFGSPEVAVVAALLIAGGLALARRLRPAAFVLMAVFGAAAINVVLKHLFERTRPELWTHMANADGYSFPSGHAMASSALAIAVIVLCSKWRHGGWIIAIATMYAVAVGLSRIYLGVHYPSDVLAGWCVSLAWVSLVYYVLFSYGSMKKPR